MRFLPAALATLTLTLAGVAPALARPPATQTLESYFYAEMDDSQLQLVGIGLLTYAADQALADATYDWSSFQDLDLTINLDGLILTSAHITSDFALINIEVRGNAFFFSADSENGYGAVDFVRGSEQGEIFLSVEPVPPGSFPAGSPGRAEWRAGWVTADGFEPMVGGVYGAAVSAVPEPSTYAAICGGLVLLGAGIARRRVARSAAA